MSRKEGFPEIRHVVRNGRHKKGTDMTIDPKEAPALQGKKDVDMQGLLRDIREPDSFTTQRKKSRNER